MLIGEALNKGKKWRASLNEGNVVQMSTEELKQFLDVAIHAMEEEKKKIYG